MESIAGSGRVHDPRAMRREAPEAASVQGEPTPGPECHDRLPPRRPGQGAERVARARVTARCDEFLRHDRVVHVGKQTLDYGARTVEVTDDPCTCLPSAAHRSQRLGREVTVDEQHTAAVDRPQVKGGSSRLEAAPVWHHEAPLTGSPVDEYHGDSGVQSPRVPETPCSHPRSAQLRVDEVPVGIVSQAR